VHIFVSVLVGTGYTPTVHSSIHPPRVYPIIGGKVCPVGFSIGREMSSLSMATA